MTAARVWLITGTSTGLGRAIAEAVADSGDVVVATARRPESLDDLVAQYPGRVHAARLDVTDQAGLAPLVTETLARHGRIDVLVNNAGHGHVNAAEQTTDAVLREMLDLHLLGPAALVRAVLPSMRARKSGTIVQMSSLAAHVVFPGFAAYCATKAALEAYSETLATEVGPLGIRVLIVEPGQFRTRFCGDALPECDALPDYQATVGAVSTMMKATDGVQAGDPARAARAILAALAAENPPLRLPLGGDAIDLIRAKLDAVAAEFRDWESVARSTDFAEV